MVRRTFPLVVALAAATFACQVADDGAVTADDSIDSAFTEVDVPSEDEAAEEATLTITAENEDDEFAKLKAEIEGDTSDF